MFPVVCHAECCTIFWIPTNISFSPSIVAYFDSAMSFVSTSAFAHPAIFLFFHYFEHTQRNKQFPQKKKKKKMSLAIYYHYSYCLKLCVVIVFLICSQLQEAHKIKSALCILCFDSHIIFVQVLFYHLCSHCKCVPP